jgi:hypothetical protein
MERRAGSSVRLPTQYKRTLDDEEPASSRQALKGEGGRVRLAYKTRYRLHRCDRPALALWITLQPSTMRSSRSIGSSCWLEKFEEIREQTTKTNGSVSKANIESAQTSGSLTGFPRPRHDRGYDQFLAVNYAARNLVPGCCITPWPQQGGLPMSDQHGPRAQGDSTASILIAFFSVLIATIAILYASGTIYIPGYR